MKTWTQVLIGAGLAAGIGAAGFMAIYFKKQENEAESQGTIYPRGTAVMHKFVEPSSNTIVDLHGVSLGSDLDNPDTVTHRMLVLWTAMCSAKTGTWLVKRRYSKADQVAMYLGNVHLNANPDISPALKQHPSTIKTPIATKTDPTMAAKYPEYPTISMDVNKLYPSTRSSTAKDIDLSSFGA